LKLKSIKNLSSESKPVAWNSTQIKATAQFADPNRHYNLELGYELDVTLT